MGEGFNLKVWLNGMRKIISYLLVDVFFMLIIKLTGTKNILLYNSECYVEVKFNGKLYSVSIKEQSDE
jgi:hypothetical protein